MKKMKQVNRLGAFRNDMTTLFAPWREEALDRNWDPDDCVFCTLPEGDDRDRLVLVRGEASYLVLNANPYNRGHLLVVLFEHTDRLGKVGADVAAEHMHLIQAGMKAVRSVYEPDGFNIGANIGQGAGGSVRDHYHTHILPRWVNDTDFLPPTSGHTVVEDRLQDVYDDLINELGEQNRISVAESSGQELCFE